MKPSAKETFKTTIIVLISLAILILLLGFAIYLLSLGENKNKNDNENKNNLPNIYVSRVIDGDTFEMSDNSTIRMLCVDAPEKGKIAYEEAREFLTNMILGKEVRLEKDISDKDEYGRLLRYVYVNVSGAEFFVNQQLVQEGYAHVFRYGNDTAKCGEIEGG